MKLESSYYNCSPDYIDSIDPSLQGQVAFVISQLPKGSRTLSLSVRFTVLRRDGYTCRYCGRKAPFVSLQVDHVVPWSIGGTNELSNLVTSCKECNLGKSARNG